VVIPSLSVSPFRVSWEWSDEMLKTAMSLLGTVTAMLLQPGAIWCETIVRVKTTQGGPQIHVNGKPVVPRWFWGSDRSGSVAATEEWSEQSFDFVPASDVRGNGTLHFRFGQQPGQVWLAEVRVFDMQTGRDILPPGSLASETSFAANWNVWPPGSANTVGRVEIKEGTTQVTLTAPPDGRWPDFHLHSDQVLAFTANHTYRCSFRVRAVPPRMIYPALYRVEGGVWTNIGAPPGPFLQQVEMARAAGVRFISFAAPNCWTETETPDFRPLDDLCQKIIAVHPNALLVPRVGVNAPTWWLAKHPEARMVYEGGVAGEHASVSDRQYRAEAAAHLEKLCRHLTQRFPEHFAGIHPCGQNTGEWFYEGSWQHRLSGYDPATLAAWRSWLRARGMANAENAQVPSAEARHAAPFGLLRHPTKEVELINFARFQQEEMADMILTLAAAARRGTEGKKLVVFFYGYHYEFAALPNGAPVSGHYALGKVLKSTDIDILCSPLSYTDRQLPGTGPCMSPAESIRNAGIMWLTEDDTRTYLDRRTAAHTQEGGVVNLQQTQQLLLRNTAQAALRGFATWWMDLPGEGWFADSALWDVLRKLRPVDEALLHRRQPFTPEIALIIDEDSMCYLAGGSHILTRPLIYDARAAVGRCGAPYGQYTLDDAVAGKVPARLQIFLAAWALNDEQRQQLAATRQPQTTRVWCYAAGLLDKTRRTDKSDQADPQLLSRLTGFTLRPVNVDTTVVTPTESGRKQGLAQPWGPDKKITPLFTVEANASETWATFADGSPAVAVRRGKAGTDVFVGVPQLTPELVRALARIAGVHLFAQSDVSVWAAEGYLLLHALSDGSLSINTGRQGQVSDALTGKALGAGPRLELSMHRGETWLLKY